DATSPLGFPSNYIDTPAYLLPDVQATGGKSNPGSVDMYSVDLSAGAHYTFTAAVGSGSHPALALFDSTGNLVSSQGQPVGGAISLQFDAPETGRFYVGLVGQGNYAVSYSDTGPPHPTDSTPDGAITSQVLAIGGSLTGTIDYGGDADWYRVQLTAGQSYLFSLQGSGASPLTDTFLQVRDGDDGHVLTFNDDADAQHNSAVRFTPTASGTYFVSAADWDTETGTYTLSAQMVTPQDPVATIQGHGPRLSYNIEVYFGLADDLGLGLTGGRAWTAAEIASVLSAMSQYSAVANINFTRVDSADQATLIVGLADLPNDGGEVLGVTSVTSISHAAIAFDPTASGWDTAGLAPGGQGYATVLHEVGHALGLQHPHDVGGDSEILEGVYQPFGAYGVNGLDQRIYTVMSYNGGYVDPTHLFLNPTPSPDPVGPAVLDIAAIQAAYGANAQQHAGSDTYQLTSGLVQAIWDTGGTDTIAAPSGGQFTVRIDLRAATLTEQPGGGGYLSIISDGVDGNVRGAFTIAAGVAIENAIGGPGNDKINGNDLANDLRGGDGYDTIYGFDGNDLIVGGLGLDTLDGGRGDDAVWAGNLDGSSDSQGSSLEYLYGGEGNDVLHGGKGADYLYGGPGDDIMYGGGANAANFLQADVVYEDAPAGVTVSLAITTPQDTGGAGIDTLIQIQGIRGSAFADHLTGAGTNFEIRAGAGDDVISITSGSTGYIAGDDGYDTLSFDLLGAGVTFLLGTTNSQALPAGGSVTVVETEALRGTAFDDQLTGDSGANILEGGAGNDRLDGGDGADTASYASAAGAVTVNLGLAGAQNTGGAGTDTLTRFENLQGSAFDDHLTGNGAANRLAGGDGADTLTGGGGNDTLDGGANIDTAAFAGAMSAYTITSNGGTVTVAGPDGTDILTTIEFLQFSDQTFHFRPGTAATIDFAAAPSTYAAALRDFDGNDLGGGSSWVL
ncbi:MAG: hypothetical protein JWM33_343, partial [Caulobacteraceae bacterium]|nr:hypothetical protein [Caulobacteraceae bacterium]